MMKFKVILVLLFFGTKASHGMSLIPMPFKYEQRNETKNGTSELQSFTSLSLASEDYDISLEDAEAGTADAKDEIKKLEKLAFYIQISPDGYLNTNEMSESDLEFLNELGISNYKELSDQADLVIEKALDIIETLQERVDDVIMNINQSLVLDEQDRDSRRELLTLYENVASELDKQMDIVGVLADAIDAYESSVNSTDPAESIFPPAKELYSSPNYGVQNGSYFDDTDSVNNEETDSFSESGYNYDQEGYYNWSDSEYYNQDSMNAKVPENINTKNATILIPMNNSNNQVKKWTYDIFSQNKQLKNKSINLISNFKQIPEFSRYQTAKANEKSHENYLGNLLNTPTQTSSIEKTSESSRQAKPFEYDLNYYSPEDKTDTAGDTNSTNREAYLSYNDGEYIDEAYNNQENNNYIDNQWFEVAGSNQTMDGFMNTKESDQYEGKYNIPSPTEYPIEQETTYNTDEFTTYEDPSLFSEKTFDNYINFNDSSTETNGGHYDKFNSNLTDLSNSFIDSLLKKTANSTLIDLNNYGNADLPDFNSLDEFFLNQNENDLSNQPENKNSENPDKTPDKTPSFPEEADISTVDIQANGLSPMDMDNMYPDLYEEMLSEISSTDEEEKANKYLSVLEEVDQEVNDGNTKDLSSKDNYYYPDPQNLENKQETLINNMINEEIQNKKYEIQMKKNAEENRLTTLQLALIISAGSMPVLLIIVLLLYTLLCRLKKTKTPYKVMENDDVYDKKIMPAEGGNENYSVSV